ncbi:septal ring lytic transglycosylase RlpA family protein [Mesonia sp. K7]|uniref:septal ring lytic transglycosylase RlpA family protein n=1 Tax=Mesonia sp. K7 TaxID=2218606 RepID=UPI000DA9707A|nr:septal ring lytic transglycosylase RlpA family protein [Mesonia sp. K7]PZD79288.1 hypothetical protein DNG35_02045 [Mesonia sp. K7]
MVNNKSTYLLLLLSFFSWCTIAQTQIGEASFYADFFEGRLTASGETFSQKLKTAAHKSLPFGTYVKVTNLRNKKVVQVIINDRGPFVKGRIIDLTRAMAKKLGFIHQGVTPVEVTIITQKGNPPISQLGIHKQEFEAYFEKQKAAIEKRKKEAIKNFKKKALDIKTSTKIVDSLNLKKKIAEEKLGIQIVVFSEKEKAFEVAKEFLFEAQKTVMVKAKTVNQKELFAVLITDFKSREEVEAFQQSIKEKYPDSFIVDLNKIENP